MMTHSYYIIEEDGLFIESRLRRFPSVVGGAGLISAGVGTRDEHGFELVVDEGYRPSQFLFSIGRRQLFLHALCASFSFALASLPVAKANALPLSSSCKARLICETMKASESV